tara:strand:+ start:97 stop:639 length:543 start_codon:yes stop_codon:yes gene_type:complete
MIENWLVKINVGDVQPFEDALNNSITKTKDVTGTTSAIGPNTKQLNLWGGDEYAQHLIDHIKTIKGDNISKINFNNLIRIVAWIVEGQEHSYHMLHRHSAEGDEHIVNNQNISTVLFLDIPKSGGEFYFVKEKPTGTRAHFIKPEKGDLLIFPWSLYHGVYPQGPGLRRTVNLDFIFSER